jgi:hypothetical protein
MRKLALAFVLLVALNAAFVAQAKQEQPRRPTPHECKTFKGDSRDACSAYILDDATLSLLRYYQFVKYPPLAAEVQRDLAKHYQGDALDMLLARGNSLPPGAHTVQIPEFWAKQIRLSKKCDSAVLVTHENWMVRDNFDHVPYIEQADPHTILLRREQDGWVVYKIYDAEMLDLKPTCP